MFIISGFYIDRLGRRGAGAQECDCNVTVVGTIATGGNELLFRNIFIPSLWYQGKSPAMRSSS